MAPSNDEISHAESLAMGGEFVTRLWALLSHVGILKRDLADQYCYSPYVFSLCLKSNLDFAICSIFRSNTYYYYVIPLQKNVFLAMNFSEEIFFVTENLHLATKFIIRH